MASRSGGVKLTGSVAFAVTEGVEFEYDAAKSASNLTKHGIDFDQAKRLWLDDRRLVVSARSTTETREAIIAEVRGVVWTAIYTRRGENVRIISVRRSRDEEKWRYHHR